MANYAKIIHNTVWETIIAEPEFIEHLKEHDGLDGDWIEFDQYAVGGRFTNPQDHAPGAVPLRKNSAHIGDTYDAERDAFIPPKSSNTPSWVLNEETCLWEAPVAMPTDGKIYDWNEDTQTWDLHPVYND